MKPIQIGDVVVIVDDQLPRNHWPKGIIVETKISQDGQVRSATVQTKTGILRRPAIKIAVLDVKSMPTKQLDIRVGVSPTPI